MRPKLPEIEFIEEIARGAGDILIKHLSKLKKGQILSKGLNDYVTHVDRLSENYLISKILKRFPTHQILAEESATSSARDPERPLWVIDPLDGTTNFIHEIPIFAVSIGLRVNGHPRIGVIFDPSRNELFRAVRGKGAYLNNRRIHVSKNRTFPMSLIATGFPFKTLDHLDTYLAIFRNVCGKGQGIRRAGAASIDLAYVAAGRFDAFWEFNLQPWDFAAAELVIQEAGGKITDFEGRILQTKPQNVLAGNPYLYPKLKKTIETSLVHSPNK